MHIGDMICGSLSSAREGSFRRKRHYLSFPDLHNTSAVNKSRGDALTTMPTCRRNFLLEVTRRLSRDVSFYKHYVCIICIYKNFAAYNSESTHRIALHIIFQFDPIRILI